MEATLMLETQSNHRQNHQDRGPTLADLISEAQRSHVAPSDPDDGAGAPLHVCRYLAEAINRLSIQSKKIEKDI